MTAKTLIKIDNVSKSYITSREDIIALETVNLDIKEGEFVFDVRKPKMMKSVKSDILKESVVEAAGVRS